MSERRLDVPDGDASREDWVRYFLASAQQDATYQEEQLAWDEEQIEYHQAKLREYRTSRQQRLAKLAAARAEVEKWTKLVAALEAASVDAAHD
jgi:hypothetical protein